MASIETNIKKRSAMKAKLTNFSNYLSVLISCKGISDLQRIELEGRLSKFDALYDEFDELQMEIEVLSDLPDEAYEERAKFEERYHALAAQARSMVARASSANEGSVASSAAADKAGRHNFIRLPKIELPQFGGSYESWLEYRDTYLSLIHSSDTIDDISKFHYLRASLKGTALEIICNIDFKASNYETAWNLLCERYDNSRLLVNNHVQALFNVEVVSKESCISLRRLVDTINKNIRALKTLNEPVEYWDTLIIYMMANKLDTITYRNWEENRSILSKSPTLIQFCTFLNNKADLLETIEDGMKMNNSLKTEAKLRSFLVAKDTAQTSNSNSIKLSCAMCAKAHPLYSCDIFRSLTVDERIAKAKDFKVCFNCLRPGHLTNRCRLSHCKYCKSKHNTLLHIEQATSSSFQDPMPNSVALPADSFDGASSPTCTSENVALSSNTSKPETTSSHILLSTALVKAVNNKGKSFNARILLDNGSTANFITKSLCEQLRLPRLSTNSTVTGINNQTSISTQSCNVTIESYNGDFKANIDCFILPEITKRLPASSIEINKIPIPSGLHLADPSFHVPSSVDILVGAEVFWNVLGTASVDLGKNLPKLRETHFGWIISGPVFLPPRSLLSKQQHRCNFALKELDSNLNRFWELDSVSTKHTQSHEERACEEHFQQNTIRDESGRFVVTMPLKADPSVLGRSFDMARRRFFSVERRFQRDPALKEKYVAFMHEYEDLGHMTENEPTHEPHSSSNVEYFLPHHGVVKRSPDSDFLKFRTVFDGTSASTSQVSLNDIQMIGPTVQHDLLSILLRFRQHKFVLSADIEKMYRAILLNPSQRALQQIVFRDDPKLRLKVFTLNTLTYGTASAPYLATKCLVSLGAAASDERVTKSIQDDFYVDDYLSGSSCISGAVELANNVASILSSANFNLRKWKSNSKKVLEQIPGASESYDKLTFSESQPLSSRTLGLNWLCDSDTLGYSIDIDSNQRVTKRHILSILSQIFDPLGLVGPCVVEAKILMQRLWIAKFDWDDEVSSELHDLWLSFANSLPHLNTLKISRWVLSDDSIVHEIHVFTDSSERAYGSCIYVRSIDSKGAINVQLLASKNRVAPLKPTTIPRLELCGALLGTRLCTKVLNSLTLSITRCRFWSDSTIVLCWLRMAPNQLKPFVRHRVSEIQESTANHTWGYVQSKANPADLVSRGVKADVISNCLLWWSGPDFLTKDEKHWPKMPNNAAKPDLPEVVASHTNNHDPSNSFNMTHSFHQTQSSNQSVISSLIHKYSDVNRLQRVIAYIQRFIYNSKTKLNKKQGPLSTHELTDSWNHIVHNAQLDMFKEEHTMLLSGKSLPRKNRLVALSPFLNTDGVIRVGGRLDNSPYDFNVKHPVLLDSKHHFTKCLFQKEHIKLLHAGPQLLLATMRQNYWPLGGRNLAKTIVNSCVKCFRHKATSPQPIMGQLPSSRTQLEYPFLHSSVDYAGPVFIADRKGRGCKLIKSYLCIFVCLAIKAVHIELVTDLTKEAYMAALNRFVARRGKPRSILSDNASTFVGTFNELHRFLQDSNLSYEVAQLGIEFSFAPPYSPHFNGIAEAAVRSTKHHLKRLFQLTHFTYEEMATCLTQIEAVLNSRPITPISSHPLDLSALTPSHYLIGRSLISVPHPQVPDTNISRLERYQRVEFIKQHFWNRFNIEYVSLLQSKTKWTATTEPLSVGTLVLIKDKGQPPLLWLLGRVTKVFPGCDGATRVAELKTKKGTMLRAFNNICPLPLS